MVYFLAALGRNKVTFLAIFGLKLNRVCFGTLVLNSVCFFLEEAINKATDKSPSRCL